MAEHLLVPAWYPDMKATFAPMPTKDASQVVVHVANDVLSQEAQRAIGYALEKAAAHVARHMEPEMTTTAHRLLTDRAWCEPIVRAAIEHAVREWVREIMDDTPFADMMRQEASP